ncbi:MAG: TonB-dependent receptor [Tannerella sp.]|nr:TonB-dependent receptor [Tannerella sp.]
MKLLYIIVCLSLSVFSIAGDKIRGYVTDEDGVALIGANVHWHETHRGVVTDENGFFEIEQKSGEKSLMVSYIGYKTVTLAIDKPSAEPLRITLSGEVELDEVVVTERQMGMLSSRTDIFQTQKLTVAELGRAACCNLAESFETNPSVDVSYADASTGARQIKLLGLSGTYVQMLTENYPNFRGAASLYGLDYVPGPWMESIQISKGTSSVKNGYEAIAGQINVEYKKPFTADIFSANLFGSDAGRYEANADASYHLNENLYTGFFVHYSADKVKHDDNGDGFLDIPLKEQMNFMNRWQHRTDRYVAQYGIRFLHEDRTGGQAAGAKLKLNRVSNFVKVGNPADDAYHIGIGTNRVEGYTKQAYIINPERVESVAAIVSGSYHEQKSFYDRTPYNVYQNNLYASLMYEAQYSPKHNISAGLSLNYDGFDENLTLANQTGLEERQIYNRKEVVPGAYLQYTLNLNDKFILLTGVRADHSSVYKTFITPRIHLKYNPLTWLNIRASAGMGYRTANILTENNYLLSSSRRFTIDDNLKQEKAYNTGLNFAFYIPLGGKDLIVNTEWYYTNFLQQVVTDMDSDPHEVHFYNLQGKSYSNNAQIETTYQFPFVRGLTMTVAYRITDAKTDYRNAAGITSRLRKPLISDYKGLLTVSWLSPLKKWQLDLTGQFNGGGRMPNPDPVNPLWEKTYKPFQIWNAQVTKYFRTWSVYLGSENMFNFMQMNPIIDAANPRGDNFDGSMIWGPVHGRKIYLGLRYNIPRLD